MNLRALPIGPTEAFVLSRVDGRATEGEIALSTGLMASDVALALLRLSDLGAVDLPGAGKSAPPHSQTTSSPPPRPASGTQPTAAPVVIRNAPAVADGPPAYPLAELDDEAEIALDRKHVILTVYHRLERVTHYELLGVPQNADKKAIKSAYFEKVATFHPDKYFGKAMGAFKPKLEKIFHQVTEAHDTLTRKQSRAEYDQYIESQRATRGLDEAETERAIEVIRRELEQEARLTENIERPSQVPRAFAAHPDSEPGSAPRHTPVPRSAPAVPPRPPPMSPDERRRALARKLGAGSLPPPSMKSEAPSAPAPAPAPGQSARAVAEDALRRRYESRLRDLQGERLQRYLAQADEAMKARKPVAAANALRIAVTLAPDDRVLAARFDQVEREAAATLADQYLEQARYDERRGHHLDAALAYERASRGRPTAPHFERAAHCLLEGRGDARKATELARKAVELSPETAAYRIVLARAYARAGLEQSALGELERARSLAPSDDTIKDWIKRVKRGEV